MKIPNLFLLLSLISFLSIILITGSTLKSYTNFYENNNHILLKLPTIYAQDNSGDLEDGDIFPDFKTEDNGGKEDGDIFPDFKTEDKEVKKKMEVVMEVKKKMEVVMEVKKKMEVVMEVKKKMEVVMEVKKKMEVVMEVKKKMEVVMEVKKKMEEMKEQLTKILMILAPYPLVRQQTQMIK